MPDPVCGGPSRTGCRGQFLNSNSNSKILFYKKKFSSSSSGIGLTPCVMGLVSQATVACIWPSLIDLAAQACNLVQSARSRCSDWPSPQFDIYLIGLDAQATVTSFRFPGSFYLFLIFSPSEPRRDQEEGDGLDSHEELNYHLRVQARSRGGRWRWTLQRARERSSAGRWSWAFRTLD